MASLKQGSSKDTSCPFETYLFHQNKGTPPFTGQCSGVMFGTFERDTVCFVDVFLLCLRSLCAMAGSAAQSESVPANKTHPIPVLMSLCSPFSVFFFSGGEYPFLVWFKGRISAKSRRVCLEIKFVLLQINIEPPKREPQEEKKKRFLYE